MSMIQSHGSTPADLQGCTVKRVCWIWLGTLTNKPRREKNYVFNFLFWCISISHKPFCSQLQKDLRLWGFHTTSNTSESAHVLNQTRLSWLLLIDDQESVAVFYISITVSARYWPPRFSNMVDSDLCRILHFHSVILHFCIRHFHLHDLYWPLWCLYFHSSFLQRNILIFSNGALSSHSAHHLLFIFNSMFSLIFGGLFFIIIVKMIDLAPKPLTSETGIIITIMTEYHVSTFHWN